MGTISVPFFNITSRRPVFALWPHSLYGPAFFNDPLASAYAAKLTSIMKPGHQLVFPRSISTCNGKPLCGPPAKLSVWLTSAFPLGVLPFMRTTSLSPADRSEMVSLYCALDRLRRCTDCFWTSGVEALSYRGNRTIAQRIPVSEWLGQFLRSLFFQLEHGRAFRSAMDPRGAPGRPRLA